MKESLQEVRKKLFQRQEELHRLMRIKLGETAAPGYAARCALEDPTRSAISEEYWRQLYPAYCDFALAVHEELSRKSPLETGAKLTAENVWLWGGPTPEWGGSMCPDTLVQCAAFMGLERGIYVYGRTNEEMIQRHAGMKKLLGMVTTTCRAPGQQPESDAECAENLSLLSQKYPNIIGGIMDDMTAQFDVIAEEKLSQVRTVKQMLQKHNSKMELYGVVYYHELGKKDYSSLLPYLDGVNLWFWHQEELLNVLDGVEECRKNFSGKKIFLGLFIHDYGTSDAGTVPELLIYELKAARQLLAQGKINALVILGDRELLKWPEQTAAIRGFLAAQ